MQITNLTNPGATPVDGDQIEIRHDSGAIERKQFTAYVPTPVVAPAPSRILTHIEFRRLFTPFEQQLSDEFEVTFESNGALTVEQKRSLRTGYKNFHAATVVDKDDPDVAPMLGLYEALGIIAVGRAAEILA
jgi:hypothetical protein